MKKKLATKKSAPQKNDTHSANITATTAIPGEPVDVWELHPVKGNPNVVRLPIFSEEYNKKMESITFNKCKSTFSIEEFKATGLISGTCGINLDGEHFIINMTYRQLCNVLFS